jgi:hypothetical protein
MSKSAAVPLAALAIRRTSALLILASLLAVGAVSHAAGPDPRAPQLVAPAAGAAITDPVIQFTWTRDPATATPQSIQVCADVYSAKAPLDCGLTSGASRWSTGGSALQLDPPGGLPARFSGRTVSWRVSACYAGRSLTDPGVCYPSAIRQFVVPEFALPPPTAERHLRFKYALVPATAATLQQAAAVDSYGALKRLAGSQLCEFVGNITAPRHGMQVVYFGDEPPFGYMFGFDIVGSVPQPCSTGGSTTVAPPPWARGLDWILIGFAKEFGILPQWGYAVGQLAWGSPSQVIQFNHLNGTRSEHHDFRIGTNRPTDPVVRWSVLGNLSVRDGRYEESSGSFALTARSPDNNWILVIIDGTFRLQNVTYKSFAECSRAQQSWDSCLAVGWN